VRKASIPTDNLDSDEPPRDRHGDRSVPPPATFDFEALPDGTLLTERETCAVGRWSPCTTQAWRQQPDHPLKWIAIAGGRIRYRAGNLRQFLASGTPRKHRPKPSPAPAANTTAEHSQDSAPPRRRAARPRAKADDLAAPQEQSR
jgi:hypothetical protein